jgi:hypothetical protein
MIETTANISVETFNKIFTAAENNNIKIRHIIHIIFKRMLYDHPLPAKSFTRIKYQDRLLSRKWKLLHLRLSPAMYEGCLDMRKLQKMSVSYILDIGVKLYLERAVAELLGLEIPEKENPDNYLDFYGLRQIITKNTSFYTAFHHPPPPELIEIMQNIK